MIRGKLILSFVVGIFMLSGAMAQPLQNSDEQMEKLVDSKIKAMTLQEKASMCSGRDDWSTRPIERLDPKLSIKNLV